MLSGGELLVLVAIVVCGLPALAIVAIGIYSMWRKS